MSTYAERNQHLKLNFNNKMIGINEWILLCIKLNL